MMNCKHDYNIRRDSTAWHLVCNKCGILKAELGAVTKPCSEGIGYETSLFIKTVFPNELEGWHP